MADILYLAFYPASYTALLLLARSRTDSFRSSLWLDGGIAALTVAALIATLAFQPIVDATGGTTAQIAVNLAYPAGDLLLLTLVVTVFGLNSWRPDPVWLLHRRRARPDGGGGRPVPRPERHRRVRARRPARPRLAGVARCSWRSRPGSRRGRRSRSATG